MARANNLEGKDNKLELMLNGVVSAILELDGGIYSKKDIRRLKRDLEQMKYLVFYTANDKMGKVYHLHIIKRSEFENV